MESKLSLNLIKNWQSLCHEIVFVDVAPLLLQNGVITVEEYNHIVSHSKETETENLLLILLKKNDEVLSRFVKCLVTDYNWLAEKLNEGCMPEESRDEVDATPVISEAERDGGSEKTSQEFCNNYHNLNSNTRNEPLNNKVNNRHRILEKRQIIKSRVKNKLKPPKIHNPDAVVTSTTELITPQLNEKITHEAIAVVKRNSTVSRSWTTLAHSLGLSDRVNNIRCKVGLYGEDMSMCIVYLIEDWLEMCPKEAILSKLIEVLRSENFNKAADDLTEILYRKPAKA